MNGLDDGLVKEFYVVKNAMDNRVSNLLGAFARLSGEVDELRARVFEVHKSVERVESMCIERSKSEADAFRRLLADLEGDVDVLAKRLDELEKGFERHKGGSKDE